MPGPVSLTASSPAPSFSSCQDMSIGAANAYRRMIFEDERRPRAEQIGFVLHLGDFIYEVLNYPEDMPDGKYRGRRTRTATSSRTTTCP